MSTLVMGSGPKTTCKICFVGEAPGKDEVLQLRPFVGKSGELLTRLMRNAHIERNACYITNVVKERPPSNDISKFITFGKNGAIETDEYRKYQEILRGELEDCSANVYVAIGQTALYALTGIPDKITKRRGSIYSSTLLPGRKVIPIIHPAAALRMYDFQNFILFDLARIMDEQKSPELSLPDRTLIIRPSFEEACVYLKSLHEYQVVSVDIEVKGLEVSHIAFSHNSSYAMSIPFMVAGEDYFTLDQEVEIWNLIAEILGDEKVTKLGQNIIFDANFIFRRYGIVTRKLADTMIAQAIVSPGLPKGLDFICSIYTREPYYKDEGKTWFRFSEGEEAFSRYNAKDAAVLHDAMPTLSRDIRLLNNQSVYNRHVKLIEPLLYMQERGILMDVDGMKEESVRLGLRIQELEGSLARISCCNLNPRSPKQLMEYFYVKKSYTPYLKRGTGAMTVDEKALTRLARKGANEASIILEIRRLGKLKSTYLDVLLDDDHRLRCAFNPVGAETGRLSSSTSIFGTGTNMQNQPHSIRKFMLVDPGYIAYEVDLRQAENRIVAYLSNDRKLIDAFERGVDIHRQTAGLIFSKPPEEISDEDGSCSLGGGIYSERFFGKKCNHALNYDMGYKTFALICEIPERDAKIIHTAYHRSYPNIRHVFHRRVQESLGTGRRIVNPFGRTRRFFSRWGYELFKEAYAFIPQSTVGDIINEWGLLYIYNNQNDFSPVELLNQIHDSIVFQIPISIGLSEHKRILLDIKQSLEHSFDIYGQSITIPIDCKASTKNLLDMTKIKLDGDITKQLSELINEPTNS